MRGIQYARLSRIDHWRLGALDRPVKPDDDSSRHDRFNCQTATSVETPSLRANGSARSATIARKRKLDCFVASALRNDVDSRHDFILAGDARPELCQKLSPFETEGAGNAGCPMHPQPRAR